MMEYIYALYSEVNEVKGKKCAPTLRVVSLLYRFPFTHPLT